MRNIVLPVISFSAVALFYFDHIAIRKSKIIGGNCHNHFTGRFLVWSIIAGKPAMIVGILALTPDMYHLIGITFIRGNKIEATPGSSPVRDCKGKSLIRRVWLVQGNG